MKYREFLKDKILQIVFLVFSVITIEIFLLAYRVDNFIRIYIQTKDGWMSNIGKKKLLINKLKMSFQFWIQNFS